MKPRQLKSIAQVDYITNGSPVDTIVVATLDDGTQIELTNTVTAIEQEEGSPIVSVTILGRSPIRNKPVSVSM